jgi:hypothetical protein
MDISIALNSCKNIKVALGKLPNFNRNPIKEDFIPKRQLDECQSVIIKNCYSFLCKIIKDLKATLCKNDLSEIKNRKEFILKKLKEANQSRELLNERNVIIKEIVKLENIKRIEKVILSENESMEIITRLFEENDDIDSGINCLELGEFVELTYDKVANRKTEAYMKILQMLE